jgi:hypothetical protein
MSQVWSQPLTLISKYENNKKYQENDKWSKPPVLALK